MKGHLGKGSSGKDKGFRCKGGDAGAGLVGCLLDKDSTREEPQSGSSSPTGEDKATVFVIALSYA